MNKLRLGIILPDVHVPVWVSRMLEQIKWSPHAEIISLAFADDETWKTDPASRLYKKYIRLERRAFPPIPNPWERIDISQVIQNTQSLGRTLQEHIARFKSLRLDVIINLSFNELPKFTLDVARFGVWSLRCNDVRITTSTDFGWQEVLKGEPLIHCAVEAERYDTLQVVARSVMASHQYQFTQNQKSFLWRASALVPRALKELHTMGETGFFARAESVSPAALPSRPTMAQITALVWRQGTKIFENKFWQRWFPHRWTLMAGIRTDGEPLGWNGFRLKSLPRGVFWADPFIIERQGKSYVFFEELVYKTHLGRIVFSEIQKDGTIGDPQVALERPYHLSYPFLLEHRGEFYMIPETAQNRSIEVYRCTRFPDQWTYHKSLMQNLRATDTTLFEHSGLWWMFVNIAGEGGSTWDELHLFHSDDPLSEQWTPHPMNPVVSDVRTARPAGRVFRRDGLLLRPSQDSSRRYGYALNINRITKLTTSEFEEELLERLEPPEDGKFLAVHTFNSLNDLTVIDVMLK